MTACMYSKKCNLQRVNSLPGRSKGFLAGILHISKLSFFQLLTSGEELLVAKERPLHRLQSTQTGGWPLSCVHSVMIVFSAQLAEGGGPFSTPFHTPSTRVSSPFKPPSEIKLPVLESIASLTLLSEPPSPHEKGRGYRHDFLVLGMQARLQRPGVHCQKKANVMCKIGNVQKKYCSFILYTQF